MREHMGNIRDYKARPDVYEKSLASGRKQLHPSFASVEELLNGFIEALKARVETARGRMQSSFYKDRYVNVMTPSAVSRMRSGEEVRPATAMGL